MRQNARQFELISPAANDVLFQGDGDTKFHVDHKKKFLNIGIDIWFSFSLVIVPKILCHFPY